MNLLNLIIPPRNTFQLRVGRGSHYRSSLHHDVIMHTYHEPNILERPNTLRLYNTASASVAGRRRGQCTSSEEVGTHFSLCV
jgi:hypothetical protein